MTVVTEFRRGKWALRGIVFAKSFDVSNRSCKAQITALVALPTRPSFIQKERIMHSNFLGVIFVTFVEFFVVIWRTSR
jgi:hypothetical protein